MIVCVEHGIDSARSAWTRSPEAFQRKGTRPEHQRENEQQHMGKRKERRAAEPWSIFARNGTRHEHQRENEQQHMGKRKERRAAEPWSISARNGMPPEHQRETVNSKHGHLTIEDT